MEQDLGDCALSSSITDDSYFWTHWSISTRFDRRIGISETWNPYPVYENWQLSEMERPKLILLVGEGK